MEGGTLSSTDLIFLKIWGFGAILSAIIVAILIFSFWIVMLIDVLTKKFKDNSTKIVWILVIVFLNIFGALIYYFVEDRKTRPLIWFWWSLLACFMLFIVFLISYLFSLPYPPSNP